jgi:hypothetical protein
MFVLAGALMLIQAVSGPPAMRRTWTAFPGNDPKVIGAWGDAIYYTSRSHIGALDRRTGRTRWKVPRLGQAVLTQSRIVVDFSTAGRQELASLDLRTGKVLKAVPQVGRLSDLVAYGNRVYVLREGTQLAAYDDTLEKKFWTRNLASKPQYPSGYLAADGQTVIAALWNRGTYALDVEKGSERWKVETQYPSAPVLSDGLVFMRERSSEVRDARTGDVRWTASFPFNWLVVRNEVAFVEHEARIAGLDWKTGQLLWDRPGGTNVNRGWPRTYPATDSDGMWIRSDRVRNFAGDGTVRWEMDIDLPVYADADLWVTREENRILGYRPGRRTEIPATESERESLAYELVRNYENLDGYERDLLVRLAPHGVEALLARLVNWEKEIATASPRSEALRSLVYRMESRLVGAFRPEQTDALLATLEQLPRSIGYEYLLKLMLEKGDLSRPIPGLLKRLRMGYDETLTKIAARSTDAQAVEFMRKTLLDPKADARIRREALVHLAVTGGVKGRAAILKVQPKQATKGTWLKASLDTWTFPDAQFPKALTDSQGRTWGLGPSRALGYPGDLFVAPRTGSTWGKAVYTGASVGSFADNAEASAAWRDIPLKNFLSGAWIKVLPTDRTIRKDQDGDGLTDLVEKRLGLDARKKDTDGDGVPDGIDLCPNVRPRPLHDREKIMRAAVNAFCFLQPKEAPLVMAGPPDVAPFEIYGAGSPFLWLPFDTRLFSEWYGPPRLFFSGVEFRQNDSEWLKLSSDGKRATTYLNTGLYEGSQSVRVSLEKFGPDWFVVELRRSYSFTRKPP